MRSYLLKLLAENDKISKEYLKFLWKYRGRILWPRSERSEYQEKIRLLKLQLQETNEYIERVRPTIVRLAKDKRLLEAKLGLPLSHQALITLHG